MENILVTGASGFIGSHVCNHLSSLGYNVYGLSRFPEYTKAKVPILKSVYFWDGLSKPSWFNDLEINFDAVINLMGEPVVGRWTKSKKNKMKIDFILNASNPGKNLNVPDPYFGGDKGFESVYQLLNDSCETIKIQLDNDILIIDVNKDRLYGGRAFVFILWMIFSSFILFLIAYIFLKNQTRPLKKLSILAETFGRGLDTPILKASGAIEIKQTTNAFNLMRTRIKRFLKQRTEMLAGVSHDLRTPLTRMKLQISMLKAEKLKDELQDDILEMTSMLDSYLSFTRGEALDPIEEIDFEKLLKDLIENLKSEKNRIELINNKNTISSGRPAQIKRSLVNIVENAKRYAEFIRIILD